MGKLLPSALLAAATLAAAPASAQMLAPSSGLALSKSEAILGAPSRYAAIMAVQSGAPVVLAVASAEAPSYAPLFRQAPLREQRVPVSSERPDVFGSVALPIHHSPLDGRWAKVESAGVGGRAGAFAAALRGEDESARLEAVNAYVNRRISFVDDMVQYHVADRWSAASETLGRGKGDCEDYALAKMALLRRAGFASRDLYLVVLKDLVRRADHAVLVARSGGRFLVLDNGTDALLDSADIHDYRPVLTFTQGQVFTHGYRREAVQPPITYAEAQMPQRPLMTLASVAMPVSPFAAPQPAAAP